MTGSKNQRADTGLGLLPTLRARLGPGLVVVAAPVEAAAVLGPEVPSQVAWSPVTHDAGTLVVSGVGKSNAAAAVARYWDADRYAWVLNTGIAGVLPKATFELGSVLAAEASVFGDEGIETPDGFSDLSAMGFAPVEGEAAAQGGVGVRASAALLDLALAHVDRTAVIATVSTCSGTDARAAGVATRTGAVAEAMEGAAAGCACARLGAPFLEVRSISNTTGDRAQQRWDVPGAIAALRRVLMGTSASGKDAR